MITNKAGESISIPGISVMKSFSRRRKSSDKSLKLLKEAAKITNFKGLNKLKIKNKKKVNQAGSLGRRRKIEVKSKINPSAFLDRVQKMAPQGKMLNFNSKIGNMNRTK